MKDYNRLIAAGILSSVLLAVPIMRFARAETMSSANFKIQTDVLSVGGGNSSSATFKANDTVGDLATGETLTSASFRACAGFECFQVTPYLTFSVKEGTAAPGSPSVGIAFGTLTTGAVKTSDGATINSIFITAESNAGSGAVVTVKDASNGLKRVSTADLIASATATLIAGTAGFGICVFSAAQDAQSPTAFSMLSPYNGSCTKTTGHGIGAVSTATTSILQSTGALKGGTAEILAKTSISSTSAAGSDYADTLTFVATGTY